MKVVLAGGGSAGHVNPLLATAAEILRRHPDSHLHVLGTETGLETVLVPAAGLPLTFVPRARVPRSLSPEWFALPGRLAKAVRVSKDLVQQVQPDVVVGFGGYVSTPAFMAAQGRPIVVHEGNARPGLANRYGARTARVVALTFPSTPLVAKTGRTIVTGLPLRAPIARLVEERAAGRGDAARLAGAAVLGLDPSLPTLVVTGGSLGALSINASASGAIADLAARGQVIHITGKGKDEAVRDAWVAAGSPTTYHVLDYLTEMEHAYAVADIVLTRSGAGMVSELGALGIAGVFVPFPIGNGEQRLNATDTIAAGGGILVDDKDLTSTFVRNTVGGLLSDPARAREIGRKAQGVAPHDGAKRLVDAIEECL